MKRKSQKNWVFKASLFAFGALAIAAAAWRFFPEKLPDEKMAPMPASNQIILKQNQAPRPANGPSYATGLSSAFGKFQTGDYASAIVLLREYLNQNPKDELAKRNLATSCFALAMQRIKEQKTSEAKDLLEEATELGHPQAAAALARLLVRSGEISSGTAVLEDIFWKTKNISAAWAIVDLALSRDDLQLAEAYLNRAEGLIEKAEPETSELQKTLSEKRSRYQMREAFSKHEITLEQGNIAIAYLSPEKRRVAETLLATMSSAHERFSQNFVPVPENTRFRAIIVPQENFRAATEAPPWAQAIYDGIIRFSASKGRSTSGEMARLSTISKHEMLHAHLSAACGDLVPSWLGEGLAQLVEGRPLTQSIATLRVKLGSKLPAQLPSDPWFDDDFFTSPQEHINELYARSHLLVEALERTHGASVWSTILTKACTNKEPLSVVLNNEVGSASAIELWKNQSLKILEIFTNKK
jgi:tetratricopeptide (TPR) repeat protein